MIFGHDIAFWIAVAGATVVKLMTSPFHSLFRAVATVFAAVFSAYVFTDPVVHWLELNSETYTAPMAALLALTGEGIIRSLMAASFDPAKILEWWRGGR
ncbi:MAG: hypothetical protein K5872_22370 [Rhizobiaceae bacterium]|nr:hypothetical protein [Rhizobiaceae bacterium]MCV0408967.1 hypothetical protein [Rhizobiaceae bacterium]